jgi:hypothetical protein
MEKQTKILLGLAAVLAVYLVYSKNNKAQKSSNAPIMPPNTGSDVIKPKPDVDLANLQDRGYDKGGVKGKYKFIKPIDVEIGTELNDVGFVLRKITYRFNVGDVIDVQQFYSDGPKVDIIKEQYRSVPFDVVEKVSDSTPITQNITKF